MKATNWENKHSCISRVLSKYIVSIVQPHEKNDNCLCTNKTLV